MKADSGEAAGSLACWLLIGTTWQVYGKVVSTRGESPCELHIEVHLEKMKMD